MGNYIGRASPVTYWSIIFSLAVVMQVVMPQPMLRSSVGQVCPGNMILFTCTTTGSSTLTWSSEDYIGSGRQLEFRSIDDNGTFENSTFNPETIATLIAVNTNGPILTSILRIIARSTTQNISVSCTNIGGETSTVTIPQAAIPGAPRNVRAAEASERTDNNCIILVTWDPPANIDVSDIDHYIITVPSRNVMENGSSAITALRIRNCHRNDSIQVAAVNRFGCVGVNSLQTPPRLLDSIARTTGSITSTSIGSTTGTPIGPTSASTSTIAAASIAAVLFVILCFVVVLGLILFAIHYKRGKKIQDSKQVVPPDDSKEHEAETNLMDALQNVQDSLIKPNLEELYKSLKLRVPSTNIRTAARTLRNTLMMNKESAKKNIKEAFISCLEKMQLEKGEDVQRATESLDNIITGMIGINEEVKTAVRRVRTEAGSGEHKKVLDDLIKRVDEVQSDTILGILLILCEKIQTIRQVKDYYGKQSKYDISDLGTEEDRVSVPIWMDDKLDDSWKDSLCEAVQAINNAAPGLSLSIAEDKEQAIIHVLAINEKEPYTEVEGNILMRSSTENFVTEIRLGKWKDIDDEKKGVKLCIHKFLHALGFHHEHQDEIADSYVYRLDSGKKITIDKNELSFIRFDSSSTTLYPCQKKCRGNSEDHVCLWVLEAYPAQMNTEPDELDLVGLNLAYRPCVDTETGNNVGYRPKLGRNGMYYCGRDVMIGDLFPGEEDNRLCGPDKGPNCSACRTISSPRVKEILAGGRWQGMTGRVYCGRPFTEPAILCTTHDGACGMNNGPACPDCNNILNEETVRSRASTVQ